MIAAAQLPAPVGAELVHTASLAFVHGLQVLSLIGVVGFAGLVVLTTTMLRKVEPHTEIEEEPDFAVETGGLSVVPQPEMPVGD